LQTLAQTAFVDFQSAGQYANHFNSWNDSAGNNGGNYAFVQSPLAGAGGGGAISVFQSSDTTATYNSGSWDFSTNGAAIIISTLVKANGQISGDKVQLGILNVNNNGLNNNPGVAFESFRFVPQSSTSLSLREQYRTGNAILENTLGNLTTVVGHWYKFEVSLTNISGASGNYNAACAFYDYGADGLTPGANTVTFSTLRNNSGQDIAKTNAVWPALRAFQDGGIDAWDNFLVYTPASLPIVTVPLTNTMAPAGSGATFLAVAEGSGSIGYTWYTNGVMVSGASGRTYTTPPIDSTYSRVAVVASNSNGSVTNSATITVFVPALAVITNLPATGVQTTSATLNGQVLDTGGQAPLVTIYYGTTDGGSNPANWSEIIFLGAASGAFSTTVTGLAPNTTYYFRAAGTNSVGTSWAAPSLSFTTQPITVASIANLPATQVQTSSATLNGQILDTGNDIPVVTLYYGPTDGGTTSGNWSQSVSLGAQPAAFAQTVFGLSSNTTYYFTAAAANVAGTVWAAPPQSFKTLTTNPPSSGVVAVLTQHNDNARTGANLQESVLTALNVNTNQFGLVHTRPVDDQIYAQPLIMTNVNITGKGTHNVVIVATVNDTIYAYDADDASVTSPYWTASFINPPNIVAPRNTDMTGACGGNYKDFSGNMGIVGTPVIDPATGTLYLVVRTKESGTSYIQRLHALDVATGLERPNSPVVIAANNGVSFDPYKQNQRPGLLLANGYVYITWASHCDWGPYHGWVVGYNTSNLLQPPASFNATPSGSAAGVWMSNQGPAADANGNVYITTGNGSFDGINNFGECFLKLTPSAGQLNLTSWFAPYNWNSLNGADADLGSGGVLLIPGTPLLLSGGKAGVLYLVNKDNMGGVSQASSDTNIVESWSLGGHSIHGGAVWWDVSGSSYAYIWAASSDSLRQYKFDRAAGKFGSTNAFALSGTKGGSGQPGGILALSANGNIPGSGIVWAAINTANNANQAVVAGTLHAYNAENIANELWNSDMVSSRDSLGSFAKFVAPTVANGKVYMATFSNRLNVYGLLQTATPPQLTVSPATQDFGSLIISQSSTQSFRVGNPGGQTLTGNASTTSPFRLNGGSPFTIPAGQTGVVQVVFAPTTAGQFSNVVIFASNGGNSTNAVTGTAVNGAHLTVSPLRLDFGTLAVGANAQASFLLTNSGGATLTNGVAAVGTGPFTIVSGTPFRLPPASATNLVIAFAPGSVGSFSNAVVLTSDGGNSTNTVTGTAAIVPVADFSATPTAGSWPLTVLFTDNSTGTITNWFWDFGDNSTTNSGGGNLQHTYLGVGTNTVKLTVSGPMGSNVLTRANYITLTNPPPISLVISRSGSELQLIWSEGTLQSAGSPTGPYTNVSAAISPYPITPALSSQYFRVQVR
jgi:PKD repeat protein